MSSFIRSLQKRILKRKGYERQTQKVEVLNGVPRIINLKKGEGAIMSPGGEPIGKYWARFITREGEMADRQTPRQGPSRGSRRGTHKRPQHMPAAA